MYHFRYHIAMCSYDFKNSCFGDETEGTAKALMRKVAVK